MGPLVIQHCWGSWCHGYQFKIKLWTWGLECRNSHLRFVLRKGLSFMKGSRDFVLRKRLSFMKGSSFLKAWLPLPSTPTDQHQNFLGLQISWDSFSDTVYWWGLCQYMAELGLDMEVRQSFSRRLCMPLEFLGIERVGVALGIWHWTSCLSGLWELKLIVKLI